MQCRFSKKSSNQINILITLQKNSKNIFTFTLATKNTGSLNCNFFMDFNHMIENSLGFFYYKRTKLFFHKTYNLRWSFLVFFVFNISIQFQFFLLSFDLKSFSLIEIIFGFFQVFLQISDFFLQLFILAFSNAFKRAKIFKKNWLLQWCLVFKAILIYVKH